MSNYISMLSEEETKSLCEIIGGKEFKGLFKKNPNEFSKIKPGFRADRLTSVDAISIAIRHKDKPFISNFVNFVIESFLKEIADNVNQLESDGFNRVDATAQALVDTYFSGNIELYFRLVNRPIEKNSLELIKAKIHEVQEERKNNEESENRIAELEASVADLTMQLTQAQEAAESAQADFDTEISEYKQQIDTLQSSLKEAQKQLDVLRSTSSFAQAETDDAGRLQEFDDRRPDVLPSMAGEHCFSFCKIAIDYNGQIWLIRLADINYRGNLEVFHKDSDRSSYFENRDRLYYKDGPSKQDFMGVWKWSAIPNEKDPTKDYVLTNFYNELQPIEVIVVPDCASTKDLAAALQNGITAEAMTARALFAYASGKGQYVGMLCNNHDLNSANGQLTISEDVIALPVYEFSAQDVIKLEDNLVFLRSVFAGVPSRLFQVKSPMEVVKKVVIDSISWSAYKQRGFIRAQYKDIKAFVEALPVDKITDGICNGCHCNRAEAEHLLSRFFDCLNEYFDGNSFDDEVIRSAILGNELLMQRAKGLVTKEWETENEALLKKKDALQSELRVMSGALEHAHQEYDEVAAKSKELSDFIASQESLASEVEEAVSTRIRQAQNNVAEFIANMTFVGGLSHWKANDPDSGYPEQIHTQRNLYRVMAPAEDLSDLEGNDSWNGVVETAALELQDAGVSKKYARGLAAFLCAAYINKQPIVLIGPNARDIIAAFSAALTAGKYGILFCEGEYSNEAVSRIGSEDEFIVEIVNLFGSRWISRMPEILSNNDIFYMASHPFAEDMQVEPKSLYNFMLPVFTEFVVNKKATGKYLGGYFSEKFSPYEPRERSARGSKALTCLNMSTLIRNQLCIMLSTMHEIYPEATADDDFLLAYLPYFYATLALDRLTEAIDDERQEISISASLRKELKCVLGENL